MVLNGKRIVFTGTLPIKRIEAEDAVREMGGVVQKAVTSNTDIVVTAPGSKNTVKTQKAKFHSLEVWTGEEFMDLYESYKEDPGTAPTLPPPKPPSPPPPPVQKPAKKAKKMSGPSIMCYCRKGGDKVDIAKHFGYFSDSDKPALVGYCERTARNMALAPLELALPLNLCLEGADPRSIAWSLLYGLGIDESYFASAKLVPATEDAVPDDVWQVLSAHSVANAFIFTLRCKDGPQPARSPLVYGTVVEECIIGVLTVEKS